MIQSQFDPPAIVIIYSYYAEMHLNVIPQLISLLLVVCNVVSQPNFRFHSLLPPASCPILHTKRFHYQMSACHSRFPQLSLHAQPTTVSATYVAHINRELSKYSPQLNIFLEICNLRDHVSQPGKYPPKLFSYISQLLDFLKIYENKSVCNWIINIYQFIRPILRVLSQTSFILWWWWWRCERKREANK
jgi:hypothetical protein